LATDEHRAEKRQGIEQVQFQGTDSGSGQRVDPRASGGALQSQDAQTLFKKY